jgi:hypothetical protein
MDVLHSEARRQAERGRQAIGACCRSDGRRRSRRGAETGTPTALVLIQGQPWLHDEIPGAPDAVLTACNPGRRVGRP